MVYSLKVQINEFVKLGGEQLVPYYADILGAILPCISDEEEKIRVVLSSVNSYNYCLCKPCGVCLFRDINLMTSLFARLHVKQMRNFVV
jgi:hypothetical protein